MSCQYLLNTNITTSKRCRDGYIKPTGWWDCDFSLSFSTADAKTEENITMIVDLEKLFSNEEMMSLVAHHKE